MAITSHITTCLLYFFLLLPSLLKWVLHNDYLLPIFIDNIFGIEDSHLAIRPSLIICLL